MKETISKKETSKDVEIKKSLLHNYVSNTVNMYDSNLNIVGTFDSIDEVTTKRLLIAVDFEQKTINELENSQDAHLQAEIRYCINEDTSSRYLGYYWSNINFTELISDLDEEISMSEDIKLRCFHYFDHKIDEIHNLSKKEMNDSRYEDCIDNLHRVLYSILNQSNYFVKEFSKSIISNFIIDNAIDYIDYTNLFKPEIYSIKESVIKKLNFDIIDQYVKRYEKELA